jgi:hypothetical protein
MSLIVGSVAAAPLAAGAQDADLAGRLYAEGVQAYFAGRSAEADAYLSRAIAANRNDPRPHYFRALGRLRQGRQAEARADMQAGAELEARLPYRFDIGKTLQRVQGPARLALERYRDSARVKAGMTPPAGPLKLPDAAVLRERRVVPLDEFAQPGVPRAFAVPDTAPIATTPAAPPAAQPPASPAATPPAAPSPFDDEAAAKPSADASATKAPPADKPAAAPPSSAPAPIPPQPAPPAKQPDGEDNPFL